jgi:hypothetical protein
MKEASFETGDRVRHKVTQIEGEIVQLEESLATPHAWVIEPSVCDVNPPRLYRYVDLEKVEPLGDRQTLTEELRLDISDNITVCDQLNRSSSNTSTLNDSEKNLLSSSNTSTLNGFRQDPLSSSSSSTLNDIRENFLSKRSSSTLNKSSGGLKGSNHVLLEDNSEVHAHSNDLTSNQLLEDKTEVPSQGNDSTSNQLLANELLHTVSKPTPQRRVKGDGSGCIYWRTVVRNGREYQQAYYQYEFWQNGHCFVKSTKYIPKKLWKQVLKLDRDKAPISEILEVLGVVRK